MIIISNKPKTPEQKRLEFIRKTINEGIGDIFLTIQSLKENDEIRDDDSTKMLIIYKIAGILMPFYGEYSVRKVQKELGIKSPSMDGHKKQKKSFPTHQRLTLSKEEKKKKKKAKSKEDDLNASFYL